MNYEKFKIFNKNYLIISIVYLIICILIIKFNTRPYYIFLSDIEPDYLMSSILIMQNELPQSIHHPGTWLHYFSAFILNLLNIDPFKNTNEALKILRIFAAGFNSLSIYVFLITANKYKIKNKYNIISLGLFYPSTLLYINYFGADSFTFGLALLLSSAYIKNYYEDFNSIRIISIVSGFCINTKLIFIPCIFLIFINILLNSKSQRLKLSDLKKPAQYFFLTLLVFIILGYKVATFYPQGLIITFFFRPEIKLNFTLLIFFFLLIVFLLIFYYRQKEQINKKIFSFIFVILFLHITLSLYGELISNDPITSFSFRNQISFYIFAVIFLTIYSKFSKKIFDIIIILLLVLSCTMLASDYQETKRQYKISEAFNSYANIKISKNYYIYYWYTFYNPQMFFEWSDRNYGGSFLKKNKLINFEKKTSMQLYDLRTDLLNYRLLKSEINANTIKDKLRILLDNYNILRLNKFNKNYYELNAHQEKCLLFIVPKKSLLIEMYIIKSNKNFFSAPILFLEYKTNLKLHQDNIYLHDEEFIIFKEINPDCPI
jgi:hypothetical protein